MNEGTKQRQEMYKYEISNVAQRGFLSGFFLYIYIFPSLHFRLMRDVQVKSNARKKNWGKNKIKWHVLGMGEAYDFRHLRMCVRMCECFCKATTAAVASAVAVAVATTNISY